MPAHRVERLLSPHGRTTRREFLRVMRKVDTKGNNRDVCWEWLANTFGDGRGQITWHQKKWQAHKWLYCALIGDVPLGMVLDHLCRNGDTCPNPYHLEPVTQQVNLHRGQGWPGANVRKTHCPKGHEYTPRNTYFREYKPGLIMRYCKMCRKQHAATFNAKVKAVNRLRKECHGEDQCAESGHVARAGDYPGAIISA